jgi:hypothetical protein
MHLMLPYPVAPAPPRPFDFFAAGVLAMRLDATRHVLNDNTDSRQTSMRAATEQWEGVHRETFDGDFASAQLRATTYVAMLARLTVQVEAEIEAAHNRAALYARDLDQYQRDVVQYEYVVEQTRLTAANAASAANSEAEDRAA